MTLLKVEGLTTSFDTAHGPVVAVNDISFELARGQILGLVGESGSGKSVTALSLLNLIDKPGVVNARSIRFKDEELCKASPRRWTELRGNRISLVSQDPMMSLNPVIRVGGQLTEAIRIHRNLSAADARRIALDALQRVGIPAPVERMRAYPHELSGGMRQRVAIANALVNQPDLIVADEPTTALDVTIQAQILYEMKRLARESNTAMIWITHDLAVVKDLADELCVMYAGRIVERGPVADVINEPRHPYTRGLLDSLPRGRASGGRLTPIRGAAPPLSRLPAGCSFAPRCPRAGAGCDQLPPQSVTFGRAFRCIRPL